MRSPAPSFASRSPGDLLPGTRYQIERLLGRGGMGAVYAVRHLGTGERRALKVLSSRVAGRPDLEARLVREAEVLATLRSPHLVRVHEVGRLACGRPFYAMDLLEGETLRDALARGPLPAPLACGLVSQALEALDAVHAAGIVHRDVKPENLFVRARDGVCVLLDFGLIKLLVDGGRFAPGEFSTAPGRAVGTTRYLPPEVIGARAPDERADVYAAGVVLAELLAGGLPLAELDDVAYLERIEAEGFPVPAAVPGPLRHVVELATARDLADRYPSAAVFAAALGWACQRAGLDLAGARPPPLGAAMPSAFRLPLASAVVAFAAGAAIGPTSTWLAPAPPAVAQLAPEPPAAPRSAAAAPPAPAEPPAPAPPEAPPPPATASAAAPAPPGPPPPVRNAPRDRQAATPSGDASVAQRLRLEARLRGHRGTADDARRLVNLCQAAADGACLQRALAYVAALRDDP
jgi:serine/threonine-protein kinase